MNRTLTFAYPGDLALLTGGYGYDRRLLVELSALGWQIETLALADSYPFPTHEDRVSADLVFNSLPDDHLVLVDGLAFGAMPEIALKQRSRLRLTVLVHHPLALETGLDANTAAAFRASERAALRAAKTIITTSAFTARQLVADYAVDGAHLVVAEPGTDRFGRAQGTSGIPVILSLGTLTRRKGHDLLIEALSGLGHSRWRCRIVGDPDRDRNWATFLERRATALGIAEQVEFVGATANASDELLVADIFALPSRYEGYGMAFAEALACGLPIVGCSTGAVPDLVPGDAGILVPPEDVRSLVNALEALITHKDKRLRMAEAAFYAGKNLPTWRETAGVVSTALEGVLAGERV